MSGNLHLRYTQLAMAIVLLACHSPAPRPAAPPAPRVAPPTPAPQPLELRLWNVATASFDPRWAQLPDSIPEAELIPRATLSLSQVDGAVSSVRFQWNDATFLDSEPPFRLADGPDGQATAINFAPGRHEVTVEAFANSSGVGQPIQRQHWSLTVAQAPEVTSSAHRRYAFWLTDRGRYVTRNSDGDFISLDGTVAIPVNAIALDETLEDQGRFVPTEPGQEGVVFAFHVLVPASYQAHVHYPLVVFLHHGWHVFRGTDNDGRMFVESPLFSGETSLIAGEPAARFPAVFVVPQLPSKQTVQAVEQEWAAFTALDNSVGRVVSAAAPAPAALFTRRVLADLASGALPVEAAPLGFEPRRIYLTGHSMGGLGTWDWLQRWPEYWAAAVPMAGYPDHDRAAAVQDEPVWAFHHLSDCYNPVVGSQTMAERVAEAGGRVMRLSVLKFDTGGACDQAHFQTPKYAWQEPELLPWLFSQVSPDELAPASP